MATRLTGYIFVLASPLTKGGGLDEVDGNNWNSLVAHTTRVVTCANETVAMLLTDYIFECDTSAGSVTINLTAAGSSTGKEFWVHKTSASNSVVLDADGAELINGSATLTFTDNNGWVHAYCNGTSWRAEQPGSGGGSTDEYVEVYENGVLVGSQARHINFDSSDFNCSEDAPGDKVDISLNYGSSAGTPAEGNHVQALANIANSGGAVGDLAYWNGSNWIRLAVGSTGQVLKVSGGVPVWGTDETTAGTGQWSVQRVTNAAHTASVGQSVIMNITSSTNRTVTLPTAASQDGKEIMVKKVGTGTGTVIIDGNGSQTVEGNLTITLTAQDESVVLMADTDGVTHQWRVVSWT